MQKPTYFEHEIVQNKNLEFLNESVETTLTEFVKTITVGEPGIGAGLTVVGNPLDNFFQISQGFGYDGDGERLELFSGTKFGITFTGTSDVFLKLQETVYNPNFSENPGGASNVVTNINPDDSSLEAVESYNLGEITLSSGVGYIPLGTVTADSSMLLESVSASGAQNLQIAGFIDLNTRELSGANLTSGTIDSDLFSDPLHFDVGFDTGVSINFLGTGSSIASFAIPLAQIYAQTGTFHEINGFTPILMDAINQKAGASLEATGTNQVQIDTGNRGTKFGQGITISGNAISTLGVDKDINISADPLRKVYIKNDLEVASGSSVTIDQDLTVNGNTTFTSFSAPTIQGDVNVVGEISYNSTNQRFENRVKNSDFGIPSGNDYVAITGGDSSPADWSIDVPNQNFSYSPVASQYLLWPTDVKTITAAFGASGPYTIEANVKLDSSLSKDSTTTQSIWSEDGTNRIEFTETTAGGASGKMSLSFINGFGTTSTGPDIILTNQWYHVAFTWDGTDRIIYVDEIAEATDAPGSAAGLSTTPTNERIGTNSATTSILNGQIDNFRISNIARPTFPSGWTDLGTDGNTVALWKFDNPENFAEDSSGGVGNRDLDGSTSLASIEFIENGFGQIFSGTTQLLSADTSGTNALFGDPKVENWLKGSGINIGTTGVTISTSIDVKTDTDYKASFYYKPIQDIFQVGISTQPGALNFITSISGTDARTNLPVGVAFTGITTVTDGEWNKYEFDFHTPASGTGMSFLINPYFNEDTPATPVMSGTGIFGLTAVQMSEGTAVVPYSPKSGPKIIYENRTLSTISQTSTKADTFPLGGTFDVTDSSMVSIKGSVPVRMSWNSTGYVIIKLDGNIVDVSGPQYSAAFWAGVNTGYSVDTPISWDSYLEKGTHTLEIVVATEFGGGNGGFYGRNKSTRNFTAGTSPSAFEVDSWVKVIQY